MADYDNLSKDEVYRLHAKASADAAAASAKLEALQDEAKRAYQGLQDEPSVTEALRCQAWFKHDPSLQILPRKDGSFAGLPDRWPETIEDPEDYVTAELWRRCDAKFANPQSKDALPEQVSRPC